MSAPGDPADAVPAATGAAPASRSTGGRLAEATCVPGQQRASAAAELPLPEDSRALRMQVIATAAAMNAVGINANRAGNVSVRCARGGVPGLLITPTGVAYDQLAPDGLVFLRLTDGRAQGRLAPSSEWRFHLDILRQRPEFGAIVHTHSPSATALACHGRGLPPFHYMVAVAGGADVRCAPYAPFGTQQLSDLAVTALEDRRACLLAHHGVIACGSTLDAALALAVEIEHLACIYLQACTLGEPAHLTTQEMADAIVRFASYGQPQQATDRS
jgi:L-fuculose-phosphate aldolase